MMMELSFLGDPFNIKCSWEYGKNREAETKRNRRLFCIILDFFFLQPFWKRIRNSWCIQRGSDAANMQSAERPLSFPISLSFSISLLDPSSFPSSSTVVSPARSLFYTHKQVTHFTLRQAHDTAAFVIPLITLSIASQHHFHILLREMQVLITI